MSCTFSHTKLCDHGPFLTFSISVVLSGVIKTILSYAPGSQKPDFRRTSLWTLIHICTGIVCACLPVCWSVFVRVGGIKRPDFAPSLHIRDTWYKISGWYRIRGSRRASLSNSSTDELSTESRVSDTHRMRNATEFPLPIHDPNSRRVVILYEESQGSSMIHDQQASALSKGADRTSSTTTTAQTIQTS